MECKCNRAVFEQRLRILLRIIYAYLCMRMSAGRYSDVRVVVRSRGITKSRNSAIIIAEFPKLCKPLSAKSPDIEVSIIVIDGF